MLEYMPMQAQNSYLTYCTTDQRFHHQTLTIQTEGDGERPKSQEVLGHEDSLWLLNDRDPDLPTAHLWSTHFLVYPEVYWCRVRCGRWQMLMHTIAVRIIIVIDEGPSFSGRPCTLYVEVSQSQSLACYVKSSYVEDAWGQPEPQGSCCQAQ